MWNLLTNGNFQVKVGEFPAPDAKWNFVNGYKEDELMGEEIVIQHYTIAHTKLMTNEVYRP